MKIVSINTITNYRREKTMNVSSPFISQPKTKADYCLYNPPYYKPLISFKGKEFDNYFPSEILGISEEKFDKILQETLENDYKKKLLAEYILHYASKNNKAMDFVNMWRKQVPALISHNMLSLGSGSGQGAINKIINITARNNATSMLHKFNESSRQEEIIWKDGKSAAGGLLSYKLFTLANLNPEPQSKTLLYLAAFAVSLGSYKMSSADSKKIQNLQFIDSTKALIKSGILDPYSLLNKINKNIVELSPEKQEEYLQWKNNRLKIIRFEQTGYTKDSHNDFETEEARNVLKIVISTLRQNAGFDDEKIAAFLSLMSAQYASVNETREAQYLLEIVSKIQKELAKGIFGDENPALFETYMTLAYLQNQNEELTTAIKTLDKATEVAEATFGKDSDEYFTVNMKKLEYLQEQRLNIEKMLPYINADSEVSITQNRKDSLDELKNEIYKDSFVDKENQYLLKETQETLKTLLVLIQKNERDNSDYLKLIDLINQNPHSSLYELMQKNQAIPQYFLEGNGNYLSYELEKYRANSLTEYLENGTRDYLVNNERIFNQFNKLLHVLLEDTTAQKMSLQNNVSKIFTINTLMGKDFDEMDKEVIEKYGELSIERAELFKLQYFKEKLNDKNNAYHYIYEDVSYEKYLLYNMAVYRDKYGRNDDRTMKALVELIKESKNYYDIAKDFLPAFMKYASDKLKEEYLPQIYESYAKNWIYDNEIKGNLSISNYALEGIIAYKKAIDSSKKPSPQLVYNFLDYLDKIYSKSLEAGAACFDYKMPLLSEINKMSLKQRDKELRKYNMFSSWSYFVEDELKKIIESTSDPFNINKRKLLHMKKKHETVFFQNRFNIKMDEKIKSIENSTNIYKIK